MARACYWKVVNFQLTYACKGMKYYSTPTLSEGNSYKRKRNDRKLKTRRCFITFERRRPVSPFAIKKIFSVPIPPRLLFEPTLHPLGYPRTMATSNTSHNNLRSSYVTPRSNVTAIINETHLLRESFNVSWIVAALENISLRRTRLNVAERRPGYVREFREHRGQA